MAKAGTRLAGKANEILEVFTHNVAQFGYDGTNLSDIANELSISKGTIVHHYGTKDRLLAALHESYMRRRLTEAKLLISRLEHPDQQLAGLLFAFILYQEHDRDATIAFQREVMRLSALDGEAEGVSLRTEYIGLVRTVISDGVAAGRFRQTDLQVQSLLMFGSAQWAYTWFDPDGDETAEEVGAALVDLVLGSLLVRRTNLPGLADPHGLAAQTARQCLLDSTPSGLAAS
ncbi:TetR/AcrR family transcriptional regulator [Rhodococcus koreensis]|jgi:AcrR family transcriptional regulator|uniref:TetR/AcrR family transcriptional regulator n=1 Tax=Rhodococcus koreensis TaxID=99653 RepID=UPI00197E5122|nr:TetR/AcrR family transcriptional regulator [Rhodococcus koreensis]QSE84838.1 TetR family transcriptional regulator [Rhodococcus koreensis]